MRVLVTGATGAVGQYVLEALMVTGHEVRVLALPDSIHRMLFRDRIEIVPGDLTDPDAVEAAVDGVELVFHAALATLSSGVPAEYLDTVNAGGTRTLLRACRGRVRRLVLMGSNTVYRAHRSPALWPVVDDAPLEAHGSPDQHAWGTSLINAEDAVMAAAERDEIEYAILRPTVVAGRKAPFIETMVRSLLDNPDSVDVQRRMWDTMQWTHGKDIARAALLTAEHDEARNQCFLVAGSQPITAYDVLAELWELMNVGEPENPYADLARRNNLGLRKFEPRKLHRLGWQAQVPIRDCIAEVLARLEFYSSASIRLPEHMTS